MEVSVVPDASAHASLTLMVSDPVITSPTSQRASDVLTRLSLLAMTIINSKEATSWPFCNLLKLGFYNIKNN
jgi:hypothetical protein